MTDDEVFALAAQPDGDLSKLSDDQLAQVELGLATAAMLADSIEQRRAIVLLRRRLEAERASRAHRLTFGGVPVPWQEDIGR